MCPRLRPYPRFDLAPGPGLAFLWLLFTAGQLWAQAAAPEPPRVLILHSHHPGYVWTDRLNTALIAGLRDWPDLELFIEYMDTQRNPDETYLRSWAAHFQRKYPEPRFDLVFSTDDAALRFLQRFRSLIGEAPIVFGGVNDFDPRNFPGLRRATGVNEQLSLDETLDLALQLQNRAQVLAAVVGSADTERRNLAIFTEWVRRRKPDVEVRIFDDLDPASLQAELGRLSPEDAVVYLLYLRAPGGRTFTVEQSLNLIRQASPAPVFSFWDFTLGLGVLGGRLVSADGQAEAMLRRGRALLGGGRLEDWPIELVSPNRWMADEQLWDRVQARRLENLGAEEFPPGAWPSGTLWVNPGAQTLRGRWAAIRQSGGFGVELFDNNQAVLLLIDPETGTILAANEAARVFYGRPDLESLSMNQINTLPADQISREMARALAESRRHFNFRHRIAGGEEAPVEVFSSPVDLEGRRLLLSLVYDARQKQAAETSLFWGLGTALGVQALLIALLSWSILHQRRLRRRLHRSEAQWTALFDAMNEMVVLHDLVTDARGRPLDYRLTACNPAFTRVSGLSRDQVIGRLASAVYGASPPPYLEEFAAVAQGQGPLSFETYYPGMDRWFQISVVSPEPGHFATITTDITESHERLERIRQKNRDLEGLIFAASHDLRSPLVTIQGFAEKLTEHWSLLNPPPAPELRDEARRLGEKVLGGARRLDGLLSGLGLVSRVGREPLTPRLLDPGPVADSAWARLAQPGVRFDREPLPELWADPGALGRILGALIENALQYRSPDRPLVLTLRGRVEGRLVCLSLQDNGRGIPEENQDRIWEVFYRGWPKEYPEGWGLGLSLARILAERHRGRLSVKSREGEGSTFELHLPKAPQSLTEEE